MFCTKCGQQIADDANVCPYCGAATGNATVVTNPAVSNTTTPSKAFGILAIVLGAMGTVFAWILAILGYMMGGGGIALSIIAMKKKSGAVAIVGLILSIVTLVFSFINSILGVILMLSYM